MLDNIVTLDLLEDELAAVVYAGNYASEKEAVRHALAVLLTANPSLRLNTAIELYRRGKVTFARAVEIAQIEREAFKDELAMKSIALLIDESPEDIQIGANLIHHVRATP